MTVVEDWKWLFGKLNAVLTKMMPKLFELLFIAAVVAITSVILDKARKEL